MSMLNRITIAVWAVFFAIVIYMVSIPGGAPFEFVLALIAVFGLAFVLYFIKVVAMIADKHVPKGFWLWHIPAVVLGVVSVTGLPLQTHWMFMKPALERADATGQCPARAGLARVLDCRKWRGENSYYFGGGFINSVEVRKVEKPEELNPPQTIIRDLGDDWYVINVPFD